jgi:urease accessory protein
MAASAAIAGVDADPLANRFSKGWQARLDLEVSDRGGRSLVSRRRHRGPLLVQRPFYPEGSAVCHLYVLHPPGGLVGGDELVLDLAVKSSAAALVTTPAAGKVYRTAAATARQSTALSVASGGRLEWLPQETILFEGAALESSLSVDLANDARFIGWDAVCFGRAAAGESFERGTYRQSLEIRRNGELLLAEPCAVHAGSAVRRAAFGYMGCPQAATLVATPAGAEDEDAVAALLEGARAGVTRLGDLLVVRVLGDDGGELRSLLHSTWSVLRPRVLGRPACPPRIWRT